MAKVGHIGRTWWAGGNVKKAVKDVGGVEMLKGVKEAVKSRIPAIPIVQSVLTAAIDGIHVLSDAIDELKDKFTERELSLIMLMMKEYVEENKIAVDEKCLADFDETAVNILHAMIAEFLVDEENNAEEAAHEVEVSKKKPKARVARKKSVIAKTAAAKESAEEKEPAA